MRHIHLPAALALLTVCTTAVPLNHARHLLGGGGGAQGPYHTASETKPVAGYVCGGLPSAVIYYPTDTSKTYPLISFAHGFTAGTHLRCVRCAPGGAKVPVDYGPKLLAGVAAWGYVIIATEVERVMGVLSVVHHRMPHPTIVSWRPRISSHQLRP